jgi:hypothetical protein
MFETIRKGIVQGSIAYFTTKFILPFVVPPLVGLLGYVQGENWFHIALGTLASLMFMSGGLVFTDQWLERRNIANKLAYVTGRVGVEPDPSGKITGLAFGFILSNSAAFPIEFEVIQLETGFGGLFPPKKAYVVSKVEIPPGGTGWFDDHVMKIALPPPTGATEGFLKFEVKFGRKGRLNYSLKKAFQIWTAFDQTGQLQGATWHEVTP